MPPRSEEVVVNTDSDEELVGLLFIVIFIKGVVYYLVLGPCDLSVVKRAYNHD